MLGRHFSRFRAADPRRLHFAAHSHHPWPDATEAAHAQYWSDSAALADRKWAERVFAEVVPKAQAHVARLIGVPDPAQVAFAPNTHEFVTRLYSCLPRGRKLRVLTTASEFHSFRRQTRRLVEAGDVESEEIAPTPWETFGERFAAAARRGPWDLVWLSHVFFDSAFAVRDIDAICKSAPAEAMVVIDGYHAFCALPVDISAIASRVFYLAGGYKYAMAGEGACFLAIPPGCALRPVDTGWYASFDKLASGPGEGVSYGEGGMRFWGATFDPSGLYRFNAAMDMLVATGTTIAAIHAHSRTLQERFLDGLERLGLREMNAAHLVPPRAVQTRGNFLIFDVDNAEDAHRRLEAHHVGIDRRARRLRFGFGCYHDTNDVDRLLDAVARALK
jgi:selenocysteine lyase/cysteine desulfurase